MDYANGKIYTIRSHVDPDAVYVGSTCSTLTKRLSGHKKDYTQWLKTKKPNTYITSFEIFKHGDAYIELYEAYPCTSKDELRRREGQVIRSMTCVNKSVAGRKHAEYAKDNAEKIAAWQKEYRKKNAETIAASKSEYAKNNAETIAAAQKEYRKKNKETIAAGQKKYAEENKARLVAYAAERVTCGCGSVVRRDEVARHAKTNKHQQYLNQLQEKEDAR
jgi:hypothetical protein